MSWRHFLWDIQTGRLGAEIKIPSFSWSVTVSDSSMSTTTDKGTGAASESSVTLPWSAIPARRGDLAAMVAVGRAGVCSMWDGVPIVCGVVTARTDTFADTSLTVAGVLSGVLAHRYVLHEGRFGAKADATKWSGFSLGTIAKKVVQQVMQKPSGVLAIDFQPDETWVPDMTKVKADLEEKVTAARNQLMQASAQILALTGRSVLLTQSGEPDDTTVAWLNGTTVSVWNGTEWAKDDDASAWGQTMTDLQNGLTQAQANLDNAYQIAMADHSRTYSNWDVQNISAADVLTKLANVQNGPDIQFRPYKVDDSHVRLQMLTGTEHNPYIGQATEHSWSAFKGSDSIQDLQAQWDASALANRIYATGSGSDDATLMALGEDLSSLQQGYPLFEGVYSDTSTGTTALLQSHANAQVQLLCKPLMQLSGKVRADGPVPLGGFWPGEMTVLNISDFPTLADGQYRVRLMEMSGDQTASVSMKWNVMEVLP